MVVEGVRTMSAVNETELLAWVVLRVANRTQAKGSTVRLVILRAPEIADEMGMEPTEDRMVAVEEYLLERGYVASVDLSLSRGAYTITPAGLRWLDKGLSEPSEAPDIGTQEEPQRTESHPAAGDYRETTSMRRPWWRGVFGG